MEGLRRTFGMAEPIRRGMELKLTTAGEWRPAALGGASSVHGDILAGRDTEIGWEDVYKGESLLCGIFASSVQVATRLVRWLRLRYVSLLTWNIGDEFREGPDFHTEMEARMKMNW